MQQKFSIPSNLRVVWGAVLFSTIILLVVVKFVAQAETAPETPLVLALAAAAASTAAMGLLLPAVLFKNNLRAVNIPTTEQRDPETPEAFGGKVKVPVDPAQAQRAVLSAYTVKTILGTALGESVCLFGFVLGFLGLELGLMMPFFIVGWLVMASHFPRPSEAQRLAESALGFLP